MNVSDPGSNSEVGNKQSSSQIHVSYVSDQVRNTCVIVNSICELILICSSGENCGDSGVFEHTFQQIWNSSRHHHSQTHHQQNGSFFIILLHYLARHPILTVF